MNGDNYYISRQIAVYKTNKNLCEFLNKLNTAPVEKYAHLHANGDETAGSDWKKYSNIGIVLQDYSKGTGENTVRVLANVSPENIAYIFLKLNQGIPDFKFEESKVFGEPDETGLSTVTKIIIQRADEYTDSEGKKTARRYPWQILVENGKGKKEKTKTGGTVYKNYKCLKKVQVALSDIDMFSLLKKVTAFINIWEIVNCTKLLKSAMSEIEKISIGNIKKEDEFLKNTAV